MGDRTARLTPGKVFIGKNLSRARGECVEEDSRLLQLGGLGGLLAGALFILALVLIILNPVGGAEDHLMRFAERQAAETVIRTSGLVATILAIPLLLALYGHLRGVRMASASLGSILGVLGLALFTVNFSFNLVALPTLASLYDAAGTAADRAMVVLMASAVVSVSNTTGFVGAFFLAAGLVSLGVALLGSPNFHPGFGWVTLVIGLVGVAGTYVSLFVGFPFVFAAFPVVIIFVLLLGWKVYSLSRTRTTG